MIWNECPYWAVRLKAVRMKIAAAHYFDRMQNANYRTTKLHSNLGNIPANCVFVHSIYRLGRIPDYHWSLRFVSCLGPYVKVEMAMLETILMTSMVTGVVVVSLLATTLLGIALGKINV